MTAKPIGQTDKRQEQLSQLRAQELKLRQQVPWPVYLACLIVIVGIRVVFGQPSAAWMNFAVVALTSIGIGLVTVAFRMTREKAARLAKLQTEINVLEEQLASAQHPIP